MYKAGVIVENTTMADLESVYEFFDQSIRYQEAKGYNVWRNYDKGALVKDVETGNQYKITVNGQMAMVFSVGYADTVIWREMEKGESVYLHRIVVNPRFKGQKLFGAIATWTAAHARQKGLRSVRMDTWGDNPGIIKYYQEFGFQFVENFTTPDTPELPVHNRNLKLALLEMKLK